LQWDGQRAASPNNIAAIAIDLEALSIRDGVVAGSFFQNSLSIKEMGGDGS
jgi:anti-anti-sigma regulatory factor